MKIKLGVFFGGKSVEHEVSVITALQAIENIDREIYEVIPVYMTKNNEMYVGEEIGNVENYKDIKNLLEKSTKITITSKNGKGLIIKEKAGILSKKEYDYFDIAFPIVHGTEVEGGALFGFFKTLNIPCTGCDILSSAMSMDKYVTKCMLKENNVNILECLCFSEFEENLYEKIEEKFNYPVIVKPVDSGSSVGIAIAKNRNELENNVEDAFRYSKRILIERAVIKMREINCSVLGYDQEIFTSECEEPIKTEEILSYKDKYVSGGKKIGGSKGMNVSGLKLPADISVDMKNTIQEMAKKTFEVMRCSGVIRIDFIIDEEDGNVYVNELNTIPGCLSFHLWRASGMQYKDMLNKVLEYALQRKRQEQNLNYSFDSNILSNVSFGGTKGSKGNKFAK